MKHFRRLFCTALAVAILLASATPALAVYMNVDSNTMYLYPGTNWSPSLDIRIIGTYSKVTNVRTSDKSVVSISMMERRAFDFVHMGEDGTEGDAELTRNTHLFVYGRRKGAATISFRVDGKKYSKKIKVVAYSNPVRSLVLTGMGNANLRPRFSRTPVASDSLWSDVSSGKLLLTATNSWRIKSVSWKSVTDNVTVSTESDNGVLSVALPIGEMEAGKKYIVSARFINVRTKGAESIQYTLE